MKTEIVDKIIKSKTIWAEIKVMEQEYKRLHKQIKELEQSKGDILFDVQKKMDEAQSIAEYLSVREYETLIKHEQ